MEKYMRGRYLSVYSDREMNRRWAEARKYMESDDLDCIIMFANDYWQGGCIRYFTDWSADFGFGSFVVITKDDGLALISHGQEGTPSMPLDAARGFDSNRAVPFIPAVPCTNRYMPEAVLAYLKKHNCRKIGIYLKNLIPYGVVQYLEDNIDGAEIRSADLGIEYIKAVKSEEELEIIRHSIKLHDQIYATIPLFLRPGRKEREVAADLKKVAWDIGCEYMNIMVARGYPKPGHRPYQMQDETIMPGDMLDIMVEVCSPGEYWGELGRTWCLGTPTDEQIQANKDTAYMQDVLASYAKPGFKCKDLRKILHDFERERGYELEGRLFGHGHGTGMMERPGYDVDEVMEFRENMYISIHPAMQTDTIWAQNTDNYLVTKDGAVRLPQTARGIFCL